VKNLKIALVVSAVAFTGSAMADDGTLGATSTGASTVTIVKDNAVQISDVGDLNMGFQSTLTADEIMGDDVCVFSSTGGYNVTVTSSTGSFDLVGTGVTPASLSFGLTWETAAGQVTVAHGTAITGLLGNNSALDCGGPTNLNARFEATIDDAEFNAIAPDTYSAVVSLEVAPE